VVREIISGRNRSAAVSAKPTWGGARNRSKAQVKSPTSVVTRISIEVETVTSTRAACSRPKIIPYVVIPGEPSQLIAGGNWYRKWIGGGGR
jgi:hypothetical protein